LRKLEGSGGGLGHQRLSRMRARSVRYYMYPDYYCSTP
jgi:hypothetical protein